MVFNQMVDDRKVRVFTLSPVFIEQYKGKQPNWGYGGLGYFTYKRTYSRDLPDGTTEEFWQTCQRVVEGCFNIQKTHCRQLGVPWNEQKAQASAQDMYKRMWEFKFTPPGRGLWAMGTDAVYQRGAGVLLNCSYISTDNLHDDFAGPFCFLMDMSMLGVGVGSDTRGVNKVKLQTPRVTTEPFVVEDSREGWVALIKTILNSFVGRDVYPLVVDYSKVRGRGEPLKTLGGVSSGPKPLQTILEGCVETLLPKGMAVTFNVEYNDSNGKIGLMKTAFVGEGGTPTKITSSQIVDLFNYIAKGVVAGGIRRSASIMFGEAEDQEFLDLKQDKAALEDRRWASNNSVFGYVGMDYEKIVDAITVNGEPGIFWVDNARKFSRMKDVPDNKDRKIMGTNPCCEMALESGESCNLVETYPAHHDTFEDFQHTLKMAYLYAKTITLLPTHEPKSNAVMMRNRRIGCSMSGIVQAMQKFGRREFLNWCDKGYSYIQELDKIYSDWLGVPLSIKTTTVKPSGCLTPDTEIKLNTGVLSLFDLFLENGIDLGEKSNEYREWYPVTKDYFVKDCNNDNKRISGLFINGVEETIRFTFPDGSFVESTPNHKFMLIDGGWKCAKDITEEDDFIVR